MADDPEVQDQNDLVPRSQIRQLEEKAKKAPEFEARAEKAERTLAFYDALGATAAADPKLKYFIEGYRGDLTTEAIRAEALDAGFMSPPQSNQATTTSDGPTPAEMAAHARMAASSEGAQGNQATDLIDAFGPRGSKRPEEILQMAKAAGLRLAEDMQ